MFILNAHLQEHNLILSCAYEVIQQCFKEFTFVIHLFVSLKKIYISIILNTIHIPIC